MKKNLLFIGIIVSVLFISVGITEAGLFRTLRQGSVGADVRELQVLLNKDPETRIALSGAGSFGRETSSFGTLTRQAVIRFQTKYASDVLYPAGISFPTGVVGAMTRAKLNSLYSTNSPTPLGDPLPPVNIPAPYISSISPSIISTSSQNIIISGSNFTPNGNSVVVVSDSDRPIGSYSSVDGKNITISFTHSVIDKVKSQLAIHKGTSNYENILSSFISNLTGENISVENGTTYLRAIILVRNSGGESNSFTIKVDIKSLLN